MARKIYKIQPNGDVIGLWTDMLGNMTGTPDVVRASNVEYSQTAGGWLVEILVGRFRGCFIPKVFQMRKDALSAEENLLNEELMAGLI